MLGMLQQNYTKMEKENKKMKFLISILLTICIFLIIFCISILMLNQMEEKIKIECEKVNYTGIVSFWDGDVNCSKFSNHLNITEIIGEVR